MQDRENKVIEHATKELIDQLLLEKIPWSGIARATGVSEPWLQSDVNAIYEAVPKQVKAREKKGRLVVQCDEIWSFVGNQGNKQWVWLALDLRTREIVGVYVGDRSREGAQG